jgi:3',5'-cyclic AMP phosphodiesterase CpdA
MRRGPGLFLAILALVALAVAGVAIARSDGSSQARRPAADGSTLKSTWADRDGNGTLEVGPGEPMLDRTELAPASPAGRTLGTFGQITDAHLRDEESPARASLLDRLSPRLNSTFRPQEALTPQVLAATVRSVDALHPDAVLETGDLIDNDEANELGEALQVLRGGTVDPNSGAPGYDGLQVASNPDPFIYRPDLDPPLHPGLLAAAERPFHSPGLDAPWYPALGNHDLLVQGEVPATAQLNRIATGDRELVRLDPSLRAPARDAVLRPQLVDRYLANGLPGKTRRVPSDPTRRLLSAPEIFSELRRASDAPDGGRRLDYAFDVGERLRVIVLDLDRRAGGSGGLVSEATLRRLRAELGAAGGRWVIVTSHQSLTGSTGGERALRLLDGDPQVIAAVSGHSHTNEIAPRRSAAGGYWLISTASLTDYPQQARALRVVETQDGVEIETWMLDSAPGGLADTSRQLAYLDAGGGRPQGDAGSPADRNARLYLSRAR